MTKKLKSAPDQLERLTATLSAMSNTELRDLARRSKISYDTIQRMAFLAPSGAYDPGYSKVRALTKFMFGVAS